MKKIILLVAILAFLAVPVLAQEELATEYSPVTKDFEVSELEEVTVMQKTVSVNEISWTLSEIDFYIGMAKSTIAQYQAQLDTLTELRGKIEAEAKKIKLDKGQEGT